MKTIDLTQITTNDSEIPLSNNTSQDSKSYSIIIPEDTLIKAQRLLVALKRGDLKPGGYVNDRIQQSGLEVENLSVEQLLDAIINSKQYVCFTEWQALVDGSDWTPEEASILGDISVHMEVDIFDNGLHKKTEAQPHVNNDGVLSPLQGHLCFVPGAVLRSRLDTDSHYYGVDFNDVTTRNNLNSTPEINQEKFSSLYERRLLPVFTKINDVACRNNNDALVTVPGIGCGQFAGPFKGTIKNNFETALRDFLKKHACNFSHIKAVYFDPYSAGETSTKVFSGINFHINPLQNKKNARPQLAKPEDFNVFSAKDDYSECTLFSLVAWDHFSFPGNDFFKNKRVTDDGVKSAATNAMAVLLGQKTEAVGVYDIESKRFLPIGDQHNVTWEGVFREKQISLDLGTACVLVSDQFAGDNTANQLVGISELDTTYKHKTLQLATEQHKKLIEKRQLTSFKKDYLRSLFCASITDLGAFGGKPLDYLTTLRLSMVANTKITTRFKDALDNDQILSKIDDETVTLDEYKTHIASGLTHQKSNPHKLAFFARSKPMRTLHKSLDQAGNDVEKSKQALEDYLSHSHG